MLNRQDLENNNIFLLPGTFFKGESILAVANYSCKRGVRIQAKNSSN